MKNLIYILTFFIVGCSSVTDEKTTTYEHVLDITTDTFNTTSVNTKRIVNENKSFNDFYQQFTEAITNKNVANFNSFIHKDYGLHFIEAPGAMPVFSKIYNIENFKDINTQSPFFELSFNEIGKAPINDTLPQIICDENVYDKQGCYTQEINPLNKTQIWNYSNLNDKQKQEIEVIAATITQTVVNTANYTFYFSLIDNKWLVTFIDIRTPCSA